MSGRSSYRVAMPRRDHLRNPYGDCIKGADCLSNRMSLPSPVGPQWASAGTCVCGPGPEQSERSGGKGGVRVGRDRGLCPTASSHFPPILPVPTTTTARKDQQEGGKDVSAPRIGPRGLAELREELTPRETAVIRGLGVLRLMTGGQIAVLHFPATDNGTPTAALRACSRELTRLTRDRLLVRLGRRIGGIRAGSSSYVYALGPVGQRLLALDGPRPRFREPSTLFVDHTLAVSQLVVELTLAERAGRCEVLRVQGEPDCWRTFSGIAGRVLLRPDLAVTLGLGDYEADYFIELDRATEHLPALLRKCQAYQNYYRSGREQAAHGVFPSVCWIVPDQPRADALTAALNRNRSLTNGLFFVTTTADSVESLVRRPA
jgi:Replication-relaxation